MPYGALKLFLIPIVLDRHRCGGNANALRGTETSLAACTASVTAVAETPMPYGALKRHPIPISDTREYQVAETPMP